MYDFVNGKIITNDGIIEGKRLWVQDGKILAITDEVFENANVIDVQGAYISPGFIDIHTHGAGGHDFMDGTIEAIKEATLMHMRHGVTTLLPTTLSYGIEAIEKAIAQAREASKDDGLPNILGVHLEGPYFSKEQAGAQDPRYIIPIVKDEYEEIIKNSDGFIKRWSFAPELDNALEFCAYLIENGISPSIAHSNAEYKDVLKAYELGCHTVTHLYSGMSTIVRKNAYRVLGVVESAYLLDDMVVEVIADGHHLPPELLQLIYKGKGVDNICLVTDSMRGGGMPEGESILGRKQDGMPCIIENGVAKLMDRSAFAGSVATFDRLVRVFYKDVNVPLVDCIKMASTNPAKVIGESETKGKIQEGYDADIVVFDDDINIKMVFIKKGNDIKQHYY